MAAMLTTLGVTIYALNSAGSDRTSSVASGDAVSTSLETIVEGFEIGKIRFARSLALWNGDDALAAKLAASGAEVVTRFEDDLQIAIAGAMRAPVDGLSGADRAALGEVGQKGTAVVAMEEAGNAYAALANSVWSEPKLVLNTATYSDLTVVFATYRAAQEAVIALEQKAEAATGDAADSASTRNMLLVALGTLAALAAFLVIGRRVLKSVAASQQLQIEVAVAQERERDQSAELQTKVDSMLVAVAAAETGDLTTLVGVSGNDAVGKMGEAFTRLLAKLRSSISLIAENSATLAAASEELQVTAGQMSDNSAETSNQVGLVSTTSRSVSSNIETVSAGAVAMSSSISEIARNTADASKIAGQAVEAARVTNAAITQLGKSSQEVGAIVDVISEIAEQTNLLALNATIEAARAGDAGRSFAVVASEVKELAKATAGATEDISRKITAIQADTKMSVDAIGGIVTIINQIAEYQGTIASAVEEQAATTNEMARSVTEASHGSSGIAVNIDAVGRAADSTASGASDSRNAAAELARMANELQSLVGEFTY